ncbi:SDR family NAD(P)-dependent oxidoreductase [Williamsia sp. SKLECPSW1]
MDIRESAVLVTGAASGLGAAAVTRFAASGATVFALDLQAVDSGADPVQNVRRLTGDVTSSQEMADALGEIENSGLALRAVVTCAGVGWTQRVLSQWGTHGLDIFEKVLAVNVCGTFNVLRLAADVMARQPQCDVDGQRGVIVMTSSVAAFEGQIGQIAYSASKGAVHAMTIAAARDLADVGVRVCTIAPGSIDTPMLAALRPRARQNLVESVPFPRRLGTPEEFAELAATIIDLDYLNGETVRLDGAIRLGAR